MSSHAYEASNTHRLPEDTYLVGLTLPSGKYVVWSTVDFFNDNDGNANTQCGIWTGSDTNPHQHFHFSPGEDTAIFSGNNRDDQYFATLMTTVTLTALVGPKSKPPSSQMAAVAIFLRNGTRATLPSQVA